jgi:hypothetical protein
LTQVQEPAVQERPFLQLMPQPPQLVVVEVATQPPPQQLWPPAHEAPVPQAH